MVFGRFRDVSDGCFFCSFESLDNNFSCQVHRLKSTIPLLTEVRITVYVFGRNIARETEKLRCLLILIVVILTL